MTSTELVLVTGGSGFLGSHCVLQALQKGYRVRTTVRSLKRSDEVKTMMRNGGVSEEQIGRLEFVAADLMKDEGWTEACKDCAYVLHVASPFPLVPPKREEEIITPAKEGTLRVLRAAKSAGTVKRVVITSSVAAISYGHPSRTKNQYFTEEDWTNLNNASHPVAPYQKSKTIAERAAWDWIAKEGNGMELVVVNPVGIFGPILSASYATSIELVVQLLNRSVPGVANLLLDTVDVRDTADLHFLAMTDPQAAGQRFIACSDDDCMSMREVALILKKSLPKEEGDKVPTRQLPDFLIRLVSVFNRPASLILPELGIIKNASNHKAKTMLGWKPRSTKEAILASAESCKKFGLVK